MFRLGARRRLGEKDMRIGTAEAKRINARQARATRLRKGLQRDRHAEFQGSEVDVRIGRFEVQAGWNAPVLQHQQRLDQTGETRGGFQVTEVRFYGPDEQRRVLSRSKGSIALALAFGEETCGTRN